MNAARVRVGGRGTILGAIFVSLCVNAAPPADRRNFVACPIVRDTQTVPCWLAQHEGELYFLGVQSEDEAAWRPPMLGHRVLVEGIASTGFRICGGIVLQSLVTSALPELDAACRTDVLPALEQFTVPFASIAQREEAGERKQPGEYVLSFEFDSARIFGINAAIAEAALNEAARSGRRIEIRAARGATLLSNGSLMIEAPGIAERRARALLNLFTASGVRRDRIEVRAIDEPSAADGRADYESRRVTVSFLER